MFLISMYTSPCLSITPYVPEPRHWLNDTIDTHVIHYTSSYANSEHSALQSYKFLGSGRKSVVDVVFAISRKASLQFASSRRQLHLGCTSSLTTSTMLNGLYPPIANYILILQTTLRNGPSRLRQTLHFALHKGLTKDTTFNVDQLPNQAIIIICQ